MKDARWPERRCRTCDAPIIWARTPGGKAIPVDSEPRPDGNLVLEFNGEEGVTARYVSEGGTHVSHFVTCPDADTHRKPKRQQDLF